MRARGEGQSGGTVPLGPPDLGTYTCEICGFAYQERDECPRCRIQVDEAAREIADTGEDRDVLDQVADWLESEDGAG